MSKPNKLITVQELADELEVPVATIYQWRHARKGPKAIKVGRHLRYRRRDVDSWLDCLAGEGRDC